EYVRQRGRHASRPDVDVAPDVAVLRGLEEMLEEPAFDPVLLGVEVAILVPLRPLVPDGAEGDLGERRERADHLRWRPEIREVARSPERVDDGVRHAVQHENERPQPRRSVSVSGRQVRCTGRAQAATRRRRDDHDKGQPRPESMIPHSMIPHGQRTLVGASPGTSTVRLAAAIRSVRGTAPAFTVRVASGAGSGRTDARSGGSMPGRRLHDGGATGRHDASGRLWDRRKIHDGIVRTYGGTPLIRLRRMGEGLPATVLVKHEGFNPYNSVKDRIGIAMLEAAIERGELRPGKVIVEPTSGNTGIGIAFTAAALGLRCIFTMPDTMTVERRNMLRALGGIVVLTEGARGMRGAIERAEEIRERLGDRAWMPRQFDNPDNPAVHYRTTGPEIWEDTEGRVDVFVAGVGTGGTITGAGRYLRERKPEIHIVAVEPAESPVLSGGEPGPHRQQGIGAGFVPAVLD